MPTEQAAFEQMLSSEFKAICRNPKLGVPTKPFTGVYNARPITMTLKVPADISGGGQGGQEAVVKVVKEAVVNTKEAGGQGGGSQGGQRGGSQYQGGGSQGGQRGGSQYQEGNQGGRDEWDGEN